MAGAERKAAAEPAAGRTRMPFTILMVLAGGRGELSVEELSLLWDEPAGRIEDAAIAVRLIRRAAGGEP